MIEQNDYYFETVNKEETAFLPLFDGIQEPTTPKYIDDATEEKAEVFQNLSTDAQREKVYEVIKSLKIASDNQVARRLDIHPSTISARRNELIQRGRVVAVTDFDGNKAKIKDEVTGEKNTLWRAV